MDLETILGALRRHVFVVLLMLTLTVVAVTQVPNHVKSEFEASGSVILLSPPTVSSAGGEVDVNPWSRFGSAEAGAAAALAQVMRSATFENRIVEDELVRSYRVDINPGNGAIIDISVTSVSEESAFEAYQLVVDLLSDELERRQEDAGARPETWLVADELTTPDGAEELPGSQSRAMVAVAGIGTAAAIVSAVVLDALITQRRMRRGASSPTVLGSGDGGHPSGMVERRAARSDRPAESGAKPPAADRLEQRQGVRR